MDQIDAKGIIQFILGAASALSFVMALILFALGKWSSDGGQTGVSDAKMMSCVLAGIALAAAAVVVGQINFTYGG